MSAQTQGPWFHSDTSMWGCVTTQAGGRGHVVAEVNGGLDPVRVEQTKANARLIAAAPELLAALRVYLQAGHKEARREASAIAKAAIAKAEGK